MRKVTFLSRSLLLALCFILAFSMVGSAASTSKALSTNYTLVNMGSQQAVVTAAYYKNDGSAWAADADKTNFTVDGNYGQKVVAQYFDGTMSPGKGSAVLSSSQPLGSIVQIQARNQTPSNGAYIGFDSASNTYYVPQLFRRRSTLNGLANSIIAIQNIQNAPITVQVSFVAQPGSGYGAYNKTNISIPAYSTFYYDLDEESAANLADGWIGSAVVTATDSTKQIAVVVNNFTGPDGVQTLNGFPAEKRATRWAIPQFASRLPNGFNTVINVQNLSGGTMAAGAIDLDCTPAGGFTGEVHVSNTAEVANSASYGFNPVTDMAFPANWQGSCFVTATGNVVTFVTLRRPGVSSEISAYEAFPVTGNTSRVVVPLMAKRLSNGFSTAAIIQNLGGSPAAVTLTYTRAPGITVGQQTYSLNTTIPGGGNIIQNLRLSSEPAGLSMPDGWQGTLVVTPTSGTPNIVGYVQLTNVLNPPGDTQMAHDAFMLP